MLSMAFLTGRCQFVSGRELFAVYAPAVDGSLLLMAGAALHHRQTIFVRQFCVAFYAADIVGAMDRSCGTPAVDFEGARSSLPHHFGILLGTVAAQTDPFTPFPRKIQIPRRLFHIPLILSDGLLPVLSKQVA